VPHEIIFGPLPKTATGKIQKFELRNSLRAAGTESTETIEPAASPESTGFDERSAAKGESTDEHERVVSPARAMIELHLMSLWERLLPTIGAVQVTDNFFDLGGTSFTALRLGEEIERSFGRSLPLGVIFARPTVAQLAALLDGSEEVTTSRSLLHLQAGTGRPVFFVHRMLRTLVRPLHTDRPVYQLAYGLAAQTHDHPPGLPESLETLAAHYIDEMKAVQPHGPYTLTGYSAGGMVAYEMAQQLCHQGETVDFLGMIDSYIARDYLYRGDKHPLYRQVLNFLRVGLAELYRSHFHTRPAPDYADAAVLDFWTAYTPQPYTGKVTLFKASAIPSVMRQWVPVERAWKPVAAHLDIVEVPGRHYTVIEEPHVRVLTAKLRACLSAA
jgi:thioesterase domain-containing protein